MHVVIYGQRATDGHIATMGLLLEALRKRDMTYSIYRGYKRQLEEQGMHLPDQTPLWSQPSEIESGEGVCMVTLGGDGTILAGVTHVARKGIPILGINLGRLGFLASTDARKIDLSIDALYNGLYRIEERTMLSLESNPDVFGDANFALNDFTLHKRDTSSMITIHTYVNGEFLNSYWADGLIVSSPTGSTGYSLSCGGPIIFPQSGNFVITPVAPHNLNVRPAVISDESVISFEIEGRSANYLCTLDSRFETITSNHQLAIRKCDFKAKIIMPENITFLQTLQTKLNWGTDPRNPS